MIIALHGPRYSGKTTLANTLNRSILGANCLAFADPLKRELNAKFCIPMEYFYDPVFKETPFSQLMLPRTTKHYLGAAAYDVRTPRELMQQYSDRTKEQRGHDYWINQLIDEIDPNGVNIIHDMRFETEYDALVNLRGRTLMVNLTGPHDLERLDHNSERGVNRRFWNTFNFYNYDNRMEAGRVKGAAKQILDYIYD